MRQLGSSIITILLLIMVLTASGIGCYHDTGEDDAANDNRPFYPDRVVIVRIVMPAEDWEYTQKNALAEEYVRADLWYDGELVPNVAVRPKGNSSLRFLLMTGLQRFPNLEFPSKSFHILSQRLRVSFLPYTAQKNRGENLGMRFLSNIDRRKDEKQFHWDWDISQ